MSDTTPTGNRLVTVIGSAQIGEDDPRWHGAFDLGRSLARVPMDGCHRRLSRTDGGGGSRCEVRRWRYHRPSNLVMDGLGPDESHDELWWCENFATRATHILSTRAVVVLDGGVGTLSELAVVWSTAQTENSAPLLLLVGDIWRRLYPILIGTLLVSADDARVPIVVSTNDDVLWHLGANVPRPKGSGPRG